MSAEVAVTPYVGCPSCLAVFRKDFPRCPLDGTELEGMRELPLIGKELAGRYVIEECIGQGGMGQVYRARHTRISRKFAIKVLHGDLIADKVMRQRFSREAEAASRLSHPNLVGVVDFGETDKGLLYLVMEYVDGASLADILEREGALDQERALALFRQMAAGLEYAHGQKLVHRDFKPDNVVVASNADGELAKILDFGIARLADMSATLTTDGVVMGTPAFMAPEQATGSRPDERTDLFSLGLVMYHMITGDLPFDGTAMEILRQNISVDAPPMSARAPGLEVAPALEQVVARLLAKAPRDRFQSAGELIDELDLLFPPTRSRRPSVVDGIDPSAPGGNGARLSSRAGVGPMVTRPGSHPPPESAAYGPDGSTHYVSYPAPAQPVKRRRSMMAMVALATLALGAVLFAVLAAGGDGAGGDLTEVAQVDVPADEAEVTRGTTPAPETEAPAISARGEGADAGGDDGVGHAALVGDEDPELGDEVVDGDGVEDGEDEGAAASKRSGGSSRRKAPEPVSADAFESRYRSVLAALEELRGVASVAGDVKKLQARLEKIDFFSYRDPVAGPENYATLARIQYQLRKLRKRAGKR